MIDRIERLDRVDQHKLGMLLFIASEAVFFALLIFAYVYYRGAWLHRPGPGAHVLDVGVTAIFTVLLLASSVTVWLAEHSLRHGRRGPMRAWLLVTIVLGAVFLAGQGYEYQQLIAEGVTISSGLFGTTFFTLTGFHGLHVFGGLIMLVILFGLALTGGRTFRGHHSAALESVSLYWHFVDVVWIAVFSIVYVWTLFS